MLYTDLSKYEKERFQRAACPICCGRVHASEPFVMVKVRNSKATVYNFMHEKCLTHKYRIEEAPENFINPPVDATDFNEDDKVCAVWTVPAGISRSDSIDAVFIPEPVRG